MATIKERYLKIREAEPERPIVDIARELGIPAGTLYCYNWQKKNPEKQAIYTARCYYRKRAIERIEAGT